MRYREILETSPFGEEPDDTPRARLRRIALGLFSSLLASVFFSHLGLTFGIAPGRISARWICEINPDGQRILAYRAV